MFFWSVPDRLVFTLVFNSCGSFKLFRIVKAFSGQLAIFTARFRSFIPQCGLFDHKALSSQSLRDTRQRPVCSFSSDKDSFFLVWVLWDR